jgi:hypothetical protein
VTFFVYNPSLFLLFIDFCGSSPVEGLVFFLLFSGMIISDIFVLCQECAKNWFWTLEISHLFQFLTMNQKMMNVI